MPVGRTNEKQKLKKLCYIIQEVGNKAEIFKLSMDYSTACHELNLGTNAASVINVSEAIKCMDFESNALLCRVRDIVLDFIMTNLGPGFDTKETDVAGIVEIVKVKPQKPKTTRIILRRSNRIVKGKKKDG